MYLYNIHHNPIELDRSAKKFTCPACGKKRFVRYYNYETNEYLPDYLGRCDRQESCGYFEKPEYKKESHEKNSLNMEGTPTYKTYKRKKPMKIRGCIVPTKPTKPIDKDKFIASVQACLSNNFYQFLKNHFSESTAEKLAVKYFIGSGKKGSTVFWYLDKTKQVRTGKIMHYHTNGHRNRDINQNWVHKKLTGESQSIETLFG